MTTPNSVQALKLADRQVTLINWPNVHLSLRWLARQCTAQANFLPKFSLALNRSVVMNVRLMWLGRFQLLAWSIPLLLRSSFHAMVLEGLAIAFQSGARGAEGD